MHSDGVRKYNYGRQLEEVYTGKGKGATSMVIMTMVLMRYTPRRPIAYIVIVAGAKLNYVSSFHINLTKRIEKRLKKRKRKEKEEEKIART